MVEEEEEAWRLVSGRDLSGAEVAVAGKQEGEEEEEVVWGAVDGAGTEVAS